MGMVLSAPTTPEAFTVRVPPQVKAELAACAKQHNRNISDETRAAIDAWLDTNRRELLTAWREEVDA